MSRIAISNVGELFRLFDLVEAFLLRRGGVFVRVGIVLIATI